MSGLVCALSGEVPSEPVVSTKSGHLFERKLITKYVEVTTSLRLLGLSQATQGAAIASITGSNGQADGLAWLSWAGVPCACSPVAARMRVRAWVEIAGSAGDGLRMLCCLCLAGLSHWAQMNTRVRARCRS